MPIHAIDPGVVHVHGVWLDSPAGILEMCRRLLSPEELVRADGFLLSAPRESYILSQAALRSLLARYLGIPPGEVALAIGPLGKPVLRDQPAQQFNKSHSAGLALFAFTAGSEVGVDVERVRDIPEAARIAVNFFCPAEVSELLSLIPGEAQMKAFFRGWTRKEAILKATGQGLQTPLREYRVTLLDDDPASVVEVAGDPASAAEWSLHHIEPAAGYVGALAYRGKRRECRVHGTVLASALLSGR